MSSKKAKAKSKAEAKPKPQKAVATRPTGRMPHAIVEARHLGVMVSRPGRGFSVGELSGAKVQLLAARRWGVPTDPLRRSTLESNVKALEKWFSSVTKAAVPVKKTPEPEPEPVKPEKLAKKKVVRKKKRES